MSKYNTYFIVVQNGCRNAEMIAEGKRFNATSAAANIPSDNLDSYFIALRYMGTKRFPSIYSIENNKI
jgi:hypothetical protein